MIYLPRRRRHRGRRRRWHGTLTPPSPTGATARPGRHTSTWHPTPGT